MGMSEPARESYRVLDQGPDVDFSSNVIRLPREITKNWKARTIPLNGPARSALLELKGRAGASEGVLAGLGYCKVMLSRKFGEAVAAAGISSVTLHTLRHTFATRLKDVGVDPFTVRDLLGHATIQMTNYYTHATSETMRRGVEALTGAAGDSTRIVPASLREIA
jgi:integrase